MTGRAGRRYDGALVVVVVWLRIGASQSNPHSVFLDTVPAGEKISGDFLERVTYRGPVTALAIADGFVQLAGAGWSVVVRGQCSS